MNRTTLFLETLDHLQECATSREPYAGLQAAALLRKLFLDGNPLLHQANREHKLPIHFRIVPQSGPSTSAGLTPKAWIAPHGLEPAFHPPGTEVLTLDLPGFLRANVASVGGTDCTVRDLIDHAANVLGGVHTGTPRSPEDRALEVLAPSTLLGWDLRLTALRSVARIALHALQPLRLAALGVDRFEEAPGTSIHLAVSLGRMPSPDKNFILDIGVDRESDRLSVYIDEDSCIRFRTYEGSGRSTSLRAGSAGGTYEYDHPIYLRAEAGVCRGDLLLSLQVGVWASFRVVRSARASTAIESLRHFVLGSDLFGRAGSRLLVFEKVLCDRVLTASKREQLRGYFEEKMRVGYASGVSFEEGQFLHSDGHPHFPTSPSPAAGAGPQSTSG